MTLVVLTVVFYFFYFYIVGFLVAVLGPQWNLTFGQSSVILLSAGVGAIVGSLAWGALPIAGAARRCWWSASHSAPWARARCR